MCASWKQILVNQMPIQIKWRYKGFAIDDQSCNPLNKYFNQHNMKKKWGGTRECKNVYHQDSLDHNHNHKQERMCLTNCLPEVLLSASHISTLIMFAIWWKKLLCVIWSRDFILVWILEFSCVMYSQFYLLVETLKPWHFFHYWTMLKWPTTI